MTRASSRKAGAALIVIGAAFLYVGTRPAPTPVGSHASAAVIQVTSANADNGSVGDALREELDLLESSALLEGVVSNLHLTTKWSTSDQPLSQNSACQRLSSRLLVLPNEESGRIRVRVSGPDQPQTDEIVNSVLHVYQEMRRSRLRQAKPRIIVTLEEQLDEIEPRLRLALETMQRLGPELSITDLYQAPRNEPTLLDRIREGKEEDFSDNSNAYSAYDSTPPKSETPEQAKRRIYLKARRTADVLNLRKERIQTRLDIERARTATSPSAVVQVVQPPQPAEDVVAAPSRQSKGWYFAGAASLFLGLIMLTRKTGSAGAP